MGKVGIFLNPRTYSKIPRIWTLNERLRGHVFFKVTVNVTDRIKIETIISTKPTPSNNMQCVKSCKMSKSEYSGVRRRLPKHAESKYWKRAKSIALQKQSRNENEFIEDTLLPERHLSSRNQRYANYLFYQTHSSLLNTSPLGAGW